MLDHYKMFAAYNGWANRKLFTAAAELSDGEFTQDCGVFFGSMRGTLNHILVADLIWINRFTQNGEAPEKLDTILHQQLNPLLSARRDVDDRIIAYCEGLSDDRLNGEFTYIPTTTPEPVTQHLAFALAHFFNHQTHHRGQAHAILTQIKGAAPSFDLIYYQREIRDKAAREL